jgi:hypothetical protein
MKTIRKTPRLMAEARKMLRTIPPVFGEVRVINACGDCGKLFGRRYIPGGIGRGASFNMCLCQLTASGRPTKTILETKRGR